MIWREITGTKDAPSVLAHGAAKTKCLFAAWIRPFNAG